MDVHVVQEGDSIKSIAEKYGVDVGRLMVENGLDVNRNLVIGQTIVITYPEQTHIVQQGDTLQSIADTYHVTVMQILRNNPYLTERQYLFAGESLIINYNTTRSITTNGYVYPFIKRETLIKTLPSLTYLSIFNYTTIGKGDIIEYQDDTEVIKLAKDYDVIPLMMLSTLSLSGEADVEIAYSILISEEYQENNINNFIAIMKRKGYHGINIIFNYLTEDNQQLYQNFVQRIYNRIRSENLLFFITINFNSQIVDNKIKVEQIDYRSLSLLANGLIFVKFKFAYDFGPPDPVTNIENMRTVMEYVSPEVPSDKLIFGIQNIGYDWQLPFVPNVSKASSLSIDAVLRLAYQVGTSIQFDEVSQTPFFYYKQFTFEYPFEHIVWFVDARSINAINSLIVEYNLDGSSVWNIMIYNAPLWTIINATFDIIKLI